MFKNVKMDDQDHKNTKDKKLNYKKKRVANLFCHSVGSDQATYNIHDSHLVRDILVFHLIVHSVTEDNHSGNNISVSSEMKSGLKF